jgi:hypothetical protein
VAVFPVEDMHRLLADVQELRNALLSERSARQEAEQTIAQQRKDLERLAAEIRTFTVLRDNFHDLYRQEHEARLAAERIAADRIAERDRLEDSAERLRVDNATLRSALSRAQRPRTAAPDRELSGSVLPVWAPVFAEER